MRETLDGYTGGLRIAGRTVTNLRYADDINQSINTETPNAIGWRWTDNKKRIKTRLKYT